MCYLLFLLTLLSFACGQRQTTSHPESSAKEESADFIGAWASAADGNPKSIYINMTGMVYDVYFISSNGIFKSYKGILEDRTLKIGNTHSIKFLSENDGIYIIEGGLNYKRMSGVKSVLEEMRNDIKEVDGGNLTSFIYIPFSDDYAITLNESPNFSIKREINIYEAGQRLFDNNLKDCISSNKLDLISYYDLEKDEILLQTMGNYLEPWEYTISCNHSSGRDLTLVFSIRENHYCLTRIQFFP